MLFLFLYQKSEVVEIINFKGIKNKILKEDKWKIYLYLRGQCIAKVYRNDDAKPLNELYVVKVKFLKHLIGTNKITKIILRPYKYKLGDNDKKEIHLECEIYEGVTIEND